MLQKEIGFFKENSSIETLALDQAIKDNNFDSVLTYLKQGVKPNFSVFFSATNTGLEILNLLNEYKVLPEGLTLSTLQLVLYAAGNQKIHINDLWSKPDLDLNGWSQMQSPIALFAKKGQINQVANLIRLGAEQRPLDYLFLCVDFSYLMECDLSKIDNFKNRMIYKLSEEQGKLEQQCKIAELFFRNPTTDLDRVLLDEVWNSHLVWNFLPLFVWAAKNNRADLFNLPYFIKFFQITKHVAKESAVVAAAFGCKEFIMSAIENKLFENTDISKARCVAAANGDTVLIDCLSGYEEYQFPRFLAKRTLNGTLMQENFEPPLFWAIFKKRFATVDYLLNNGGSPNNYTDKDLPVRDSYLQIAIRRSNIDIVKILLFYGADIDFEDNAGNTALHTAAMNNKFKMIDLLIESGANTTKINKKNKTFIDLIQDRDKQLEFQALIEPTPSKDAEDAEPICSIF